MRQNLTNPFRHPQKFQCSTQAKTDLLAHSTTKQSQVRSSRNCTQDGIHSIFFHWCKKGHCAYYNVCAEPDAVYTDEWFIHYYLTPEEEKDGVIQFDFGFVPHRGIYKVSIPFKVPTDWKKTFSWHCSILLENQTSEIPLERTKWIQGTSLWFDQAFNPTSHVGHGSEFYWKVNDVRASFPGRVDRVISPRARSSFNIDGCGMLKMYPTKSFCKLWNLFFSGFEDTNWEVPPTYFLKPQKELGLPQDHMLCFEKVLVPANSRIWFTSKQAANIYREKGLRMCNLTQRVPYSESSIPKHLLFFQRGFDRWISNAGRIEQMTTDLQKIFAILFATNTTR